MPARQTHRHTGGIVEVWHRINQLGVGRDQQRLLELIHIHAIFVHAYCHIIWLIRIKGNQSAEEGGIFGNHHIARIEKQFCHQIEPLLATMQYQHIIGATRRPLAGHAGRDLGT